MRGMEPLFRSVAGFGHQELAAPDKDTKTVHDEHSTATTPDASFGRLQYAQLCRRSLLVTTTTAFGEFQPLRHPEATSPG